MGKKSLGRSMNQIFVDHAMPDGEGEVLQGEMLQKIPLELIDVNPYQPRQQFDEESLQELADSIKTHGMIQPITVRKHDGRYQIVSGERRTRAAKLAGWSEIDARVHDMLSDKSMMEWALIENLQRADLNPIEVGFSYRQLIDIHGYTHEELAERVNKSRSAVTNSIRLLKLPDSVQNWIREGKLSAGSARTLLSPDISDPEAQAIKIMEGGMNVRQAEQKKRESSPKTKEKPAIDPYLQKIVEDFQYALGTKVSLQGQGKNLSKGKLIVEYESIEDLERLINLLQAQV